jgi:hypothetical protein
VTFATAQVDRGYPDAPVGIVVVSNTAPLHGQLVVQQDCLQSHEKLMCL